MAFFPRNFYNNNNVSDASFTPLFRLLDDFDSYSRQGQGQGPCQSGRRTAIPQWQPKFDVRETGDAFELHGELPGMTKENVQIEFTEPQSMLIRGKTERTYTTGTAPTALVEENQTKAVENSDDKPADERRNSHQATVEDEQDAEWETKSTDSSKSTREVSKTPSQQQVQKKPVDQAKYWLTERSIGEFSRTFNFPTRVDHDSVSANFKDGILSITIPKAKKHETRRIIVN